MWPFASKPKPKQKLDLQIFQLVVTAPYLCESLEPYIMRALDSGSNVFIFPSAPEYTRKLIPVGYGVGLQFYSMFAGEIKAKYLISPSPTMSIMVEDYPHTIHDWQHIKFAWQNTYHKYFVQYRDVKSGEMMELYNDCKRKVGIHSS